MLEAELSAIDPDLPFEAVVSNLHMQMDALVQQRPELKAAFNSATGFEDAAVDARKACHGISEVLEDYATSKKESSYLEASELLQKLFHAAGCLKDHTKLLFVARALHSAFVRESAHSESQQMRVCQLIDRLAQARTEQSRLRRDLLDATVARLDESRRVKKLQRIADEATERSKFLELQADALRKKKTRR